MKTVFQGAALLNNAVYLASSITALNPWRGAAATLVSAASIASIIKPDSIEHMRVLYAAGDTAAAALAIASGITRQHPAELTGSAVWFALSANRLRIALNSQQVEQNAQNNTIAPDALEAQRASNFRQLLMNNVLDYGTIAAQGIEAARNNEWMFVASLALAATRHTAELFLARAPQAPER